MNWKYVCPNDVADKIYKWVKERGGVAIWSSINLSNPCASWTTPALTPDGKPYTKPTWQAGDTPNILTDPADIGVSIDKEVKRFHVAIRVGSNGLQLKCTDASSTKIEKAVAAAGKGAFYRFDYDSQEAVIYAQVKTCSLEDYMAILSYDQKDTQMDFSKFTDFQKRMYEDSRCICCGQKIKRKPERLIGPALECPECFKMGRCRDLSGYAHGGRGQASIGAEYRRRLGYASSEPGANEGRHDDDKVYIDRVARRRW